MFNTFFQSTIQLREYIINFQDSWTIPYPTCIYHQLRSIVKHVSSLSVLNGHCDAGLWPPITAPQRKDHFDMWANLWLCGPHARGMGGGGRDFDGQWANEGVIWTAYGIQALTTTNRCVDHSKIRGRRFSKLSAHPPRCAEVGAHKVVAVCGAGVKTHVGNVATQNLSSFIFCTLSSPH